MKLCRRMLALAALCGIAFPGTGQAQTGLTTIQDTLFKADGTRFNGTLTIQWSTFDAVNIGTIVQQSKNVQVVNGNLYVQLVPNAGEPAPANVYTVHYQSDGNQQFTELWTVPVSTQPLTVSAVRTGTVSVTTGGSTSGTSGNSGSSSAIPESSVTGLVADLSQRPTKGAAYGTNGVAVVDNNGILQTAAGQVGDCVLVDGTTGPCGAPTYSDAETPGGIVDGSNNTFTLANTPLGTSLMMFRNGLYMTVGSDYNLTGSTVQFVAGAVPQPGDTLTASYRVDLSASGDIANVVTTTVRATSAAQVICSASGTATGAAAWNSLGACDVPASQLQNGDRIEVRFSFAHTGTASGFSLQINWGATTILARTGTTQDAAFAGTAEAAITATGAQLSVQSWGTILPFLPAILNSPVQNGVRIDLLAALLNAGSDTVTLTNYTVLRYPAN
jgi:hypothetical protein